jgi:hypothetical protein
MRSWLLMAAAGGRIDEQARGTFVVFTSWDQDDPAEGDLAQAAVELADRHEFVQLQGEGRLDTYLIPLDDARGIQFDVGVTARVVVRSNV